MRCWFGRGPWSELGLLGVSQSSGRGRLLLLAIPANSPLPPPTDLVTGTVPTEVPARCSGVSTLTRAPAGPSEVSILDEASRDVGAKTTPPAPTTPDVSSYRTATLPLTKLATVTRVSFCSLHLPALTCHSHSPYLYFYPYRYFTLFSLSLSFFE